MHSGHELVSHAEGPFYPLPANFRIALPSEPMRIDPPAFAVFDNFRALGDQIPRRDGQHQAQPLQRLRRADQGRLELEAMRFIIQEVLFNVKSQPVFFKGLHVSRLIADDSPLFFAILASSQCQMDRTILGPCHGDMMPKPRFPQRQREATGFARPMTTTIDPEAALEANTPMPV